MFIVQFFSVYNISFFTTASINGIYRIIFSPDKDYWIRFPFVSDDHPQYADIQSILILYCFPIIGISVPLIDSPLIIIGVQIMGFLDIIKDGVKELKEDEFKNKFPQILKNVHEIHCEFTKVFKDFNTATCFASLFQFSGSILMFLCTFSVIRFHPNEYLMHMCIVCLFGQLTLFCLFGHIIYLKTDRICDELYQTNWYDFSIADKKRFLLMLKISQLNYCMKAGGMYDINIYQLFQVRYYFVKFEYINTIFIFILFYRLLNLQ